MVYLKVSLNNCEKKFINCDVCDLNSFMRTLSLHFPELMCKPKLTFKDGCNTKIECDALMDVIHQFKNSSSFEINMITGRPRSSATMQSCGNTRPSSAMRSSRHPSAMGSGCSGMR